MKLTSNMPNSARKSNTNLAFKSGGAFKLDSTDTARAISTFMNSVNQKNGNVSSQGLADYEGNYLYTGDICCIRSFAQDPVSFKNQLEKNNQVVDLQNIKFNKVSYIDQ